MRHSALIPPSFTTRSHLFISGTMNLPKSSELILRVEAPSLANWSWIAGASWASSSALCSRAMIGAGVPAGASSAPPVQRLVAGNAGLRDRRNVGQRRNALLAAGAERPQASGLDVRHRLDERREHDLVVAAQHIDQRRPAAAERHVQQIDLGLEPEQFGAEMLERADAGRGVLSSPGFSFAIASSSFSELHRQARMHRQHIGAGAHDADRRERLDRVVGQLVQPRIDRVRDAR